MDKSNYILGQLFGDLGVFSGSFNTDAFSGIIATLLSVVLAIGGILTTYTILAGVMGTAHDGQMMGKKFSSVWIPIRISMGTALIMPAVKGYCLIQVIVGWLIVQGIGFANDIWYSYTKVSNLEKSVIVGAGINNGGIVSRLQDDGYKVFSALACVRGYEKIYKDTQERNGYDDVIKFGITTEGNILHFGALQERDGFFKDSCGSVNTELPLLTLGKVKDGIQWARSGFGTVGIFGADITGLQARVEMGDKANITALKTLISSLDGVAQSFVASPNANVVSQIDNINDIYVREVLKQGQETMAYLGNFKEIEESAKRDGWISAGAYFMKLSAIHDTAQKVIARIPEIQVNDATKISPMYQDQYTLKYGNVFSAIQKHTDKSFGVETATSGTIGEQDEVSKWIKGKLIALLKNTTTNNDPDNVMIYMKKQGELSLTMAVFMGSTLGIIEEMDNNIASKGVQGITSIMTLGASSVAKGAIIGPLKMLASVMFPIFLSLGFLLSYVLPMMPFMIFFGVVVSWVVMCVEALIAAPLWCVMHLNPKGDDLVGSAGNGYRLVLSLILRPMLIIFGFIASITLLDVLGNYLQVIFYDVFNLSQQGSELFTWIISLAVAPLILFGLMFSLIQKCLSLIHVIPDEMLNWFGGGGAQLTGGMSDFNNVKGMAFAGVVGGAGLGGIASGVASKAEQKAIRERNDNKKGSGSGNDKNGNRNDPSFPHKKETNDMEYPTESSMDNVSIEKEDFDSIANNNKGGNAMNNNVLDKSGNVSVMKAIDLANQRINDTAMQNREIETDTQNTEAVEKPSNKISVSDSIKKANERIQVKKDFETMQQAQINAEPQIKEDFDNLINDFDNGIDRE